MHGNMDYKDAMKILDRYVEREHGGNVADASRALGVNYAAFSRWVKRERVPNADIFSKIMQQLGVDLVLKKEEAIRDICFVDAKIVPAGEGQRPLSNFSCFLL